MRLGVRCSTTAEALALRQELRREWQPALERALERKLDAIDSGESVVRIPRLEVRLRLDGRADIATQLLASIDRAIAEALDDALAHARTGRQSSEESMAEEALDDIAEVSPAEYRSELLRHYLATGSLPWHVRGVDAEAELRVAVRENARRLAAMIARRDLGPARVFRLLDVSDDEAIIDEVIAIGSPRVAALARLARAALGGRFDAIGRYSLLRVAAALLSHEADRAGAGNVRSESVAAEAVRPTTDTAASSGTTGMQREPEAPARFVEALVALAASSDRRLVRAMLVALREEVAEVAPREARNAREDVEPAAGAGGGDEASPGEAVAVGHAGLVLLHPFLPSLFERRGVIVAASQTAPQELARAAALLHHVATGSERPREHECGLIKVMLGLRPDSPLPLAEGLIDEEDRDEVERMLAAAITHWRVLRATSSAGLRSTFLARRGLLRRAVHGWTLHVEPASFDVLLEEIPWSFSIVRLPWMSTPIFTEWPLP